MGNDIVCYIERLDPDTCLRISFCHPTTGFRNYSINAQSRFFASTKGKRGRLFDGD